MADFGSGIDCSFDPPSLDIQLDPPRPPSSVVVAVAGPPGRDGQASIPSLIDCGGPNDSSGA